MLVKGVDTLFRGAAKLMKNGRVVKAIAASNFILTVSP